MRGKTSPQHGFRGFSAAAFDEVVQELQGMAGCGDGGGQNCRIEFSLSLRAYGGGRCMYTSLHPFLCLCWIFSCPTMVPSSSPRGTSLGDPRSWPYRWMMAPRAIYSSSTKWKKESILFEKTAPFFPLKWRILYPRWWATKRWQWLFRCCFRSDIRVSTLWF